MKIYDLQEGDKIPFTVDGLDILLIKTNQKIHIIENRCGHFGVPLTNGTLVENSIRCSQHSAMFNLIDGHVMNDCVEQCDNIRIFNWKEDNNVIIFMPDAVN